MPASVFNKGVELLRRLRFNLLFPDLLDCMAPAVGALSTVERACMSIPQAAILTECLPPTCTSLTSLSSWRRLPVHCSAAAIVCFLNLVFRSSSVSVTVRTPSPEGTTGMCLPQAEQCQCCSSWQAGRLCRCCRQTTRSWNQDATPDQGWTNWTIEHATAATCAQCADEHTEP